MLDIESSALIDLLRDYRAAGNESLASHLKEIEEECENSGKNAFEVIENFGFFTRQEMLQAMAENLGSYIWNPKAKDLERDLIKLIDVDTARTYGVIPVEDDGDSLHMAMRHPLDFQPQESLRFIIGRNIFPVICDPDQFESELDRYYPEKEDTVDDIVAELGEFEVAEEDIPDEDNLPDDFEPDAEMDVEVDVDSLPEETMDFDSLPDAQDFENMINSDVQDMADYASQYDGSKEDIGDIEDYGDVDVDMDADLGDMEVMEDPIEPEANFEMDIDTSELAEIAEGAEEAIELIATIL